MKATLLLLGTQREEIQCGAIFGRGPIFGSTGVLADVELRGWNEPTDEGETMLTPDPIKSHGSVYGAPEQPPEVRDLIEGAMDAEEMFDLDELERFADKQRRKEQK